MNKQKKKTYSSVSKMLGDTLENEEHLSQEEFDAVISSRKLIKELIAVRTVEGLSQKQVADKMNYTQSKISKFENSCDDDLSLGDVKQYMDALGLKMLVGGKRKGVTLVDEIKIMAISIKRKLDELAKLAGEDHAMAAGIASFYAEAFFNFNKMLIDNVERLPSNPQNDEPSITFYLEDEGSADESDEIASTNCSEENAVVA